MKKVITLSIVGACALMAQEVEVEVVEVERGERAVSMEASEGAVSLFDGKSLGNWRAMKGDEGFWFVKDGELSGGDLENDVPRNVWLISEKSYENFELTFAVKFTDGGGGGLKNSGVQVRSLPMGRHVCGYQIDAGPTHPDKVINGGLGYWGNIWDEHRRGALVTAVNQDKLLASVKQFDGWNRYKIVCDGASIKTWINGVLAHDYTEEDVKRIAADGVLALQAHGGGRFLVHFRDVRIKELPATEGSTKWSDEGVLKGKPKRQKKVRRKKAAVTR